LRYIFPEATLGTVILKQVSKNFWAGEIIDGYYFNTFHFIDLAIYEPADATKSINGYFYCTHDS
jgi:hypothetical protein